MNLLIDPLPDTVKIGGDTVHICSDFRTSIRFELLMQNEKLTQKEKVLLALKMYFGDIPMNIEEGIDRILWFYRCGKGVIELNKLGEGIGGHVPAYSIDQDEKYIYAAFLTQYGIDLTTVQDLHWWTFRALFESLQSNHKFVEIMNYRMIKIHAGMSQEQKRFYTRMKEKYGIKDQKKPSYEQYQKQMKDYVSKRFME